MEHARSVVRDNIVVDYHALVATIVATAAVVRVRLVVSVATPVPTLPSTVDAGGVPVEALDLRIRPTANASRDVSSISMGVYLATQMTFIAIAVKRIDISTWEYVLGVQQVHLAQVVQ
jgi:hypothetical protein